MNTGSQSSSHNQDVLDLLQARKAGLRFLNTPSEVVLFKRAWRSKIELYTSILRSPDRYMIRMLNSVRWPPMHSLKYLNLNQRVKISNLRMICRLWERPFQMQCTRSHEEGRDIIKVQVHLPVEEAEDVALRSLDLFKSFTSLPLTFIVRDCGTFKVRYSKECPYDVLKGGEHVVIPTPLDTTDRIRVEVLSFVSVKSVFAF